MNHKSIILAGYTGRRSGFLLAAGLVLFFCVAAYGIALNGPLFFDDLPNITENGRLKLNGTTFDHWREAALSSDAGTLKRPVAMLSFAVNYVVAGEFTPFSLKATNLFIHILIALAIFGFCRGVLQAPASAVLCLSPKKHYWIALAAAAIWLLHPIQVSTVLYAVQRMAQLSTLFIMGGLWLFVHYRLRWSAQGATSGEVAGAVLWLAFITVMATLSKENGALLPLLALVTEVAFFRGAFAGRERPLLRGMAWTLLLLPFVAVALVLLFVPEFFGDSFRGREFTLDERLYAQLRVLWRYVSMLVFPNILQMGFFHDDVKLSSDLFNPLSTLLSLLAWIALIAFAAIQRRRSPVLLFAVLFFLVGHSLESSVLPLQIAFEHRNYLPAVGLFLLLATLLVKLGFKAEGIKPPVIPGAFVLLLLVLLSVRTSIWQDELSLARFNVVNHPESPRANFFYGNALFKRFQMAPELGLSEEEVKALAVTSRQYFERMYQNDPRDFAALVMLYQLDTLYFPRLAVDNDWLGKMQALAATRRIQASDRAAIGALMSFAMKPGAEPDRAAISDIMSLLVERYPKRMDLLALQYRYLASQGPAGEEQLRVLLEQTMERVQGSPQAAAYMAQFHSNDDLAQTYEAIRQWMIRDTLRRELSLVSRIFSN